MKKEKSKIVIYPNPILKQTSHKVSLPMSADEENLIRDMFEVVKGIGVGLAAPQLGVSKQIVIIHLSEDEDFRKVYKEPDLVIINPAITFYSSARVSMIEGCLSFPDEYYRINRPANISMEFESITNLKEFLRGQPAITKKKTLGAKGWLSRVIQHEVDHLNGNLFINAGGKKTTDSSNVVD